MRPRLERWERVHPEVDEEIAGDAELAVAARLARHRLVRTVVSRLGELPPAYIDALLMTPRERFVLPEDIAHSADDAPLPLDPDGQATVSAPHAYVLTFRLLDLEAGDHLLELGTGTGYGAALALAIVGPSGHVTTIEIDPELAERAGRLLGGSGDDITALRGDARELAARAVTAGKPPNKIAVTYAMREIPDVLVRALPEKGVLVAPVGEGETDQELIRLARKGGVIERSRHGAVRYVMER
jgi:protein-L-isoaspartate(D-aspartate) O-methyltransferase